MVSWTRRVGIGVGLVGVLVACRGVEPIDAQICGNRLVEEGEDCDGTFADGGGTCAEPGDAHACRFVCATPSDGAAVACPAGFACDADEGVCRRPRGSFEQVSATLPGSVEPLLATNLDEDAADGRDELIVTLPSEVATLYFDSSLQLEQRVDVSLRSRDEAVGAVQNNGRQDLALLLDGSNQDLEGFLGVLQTNADRSFTPRAFSSLEGLFQGATSATVVETVTTFFGETALRLEGPPTAGIKVLDQAFEERTLYEGGDIALPAGLRLVGVSSGNPVPESNRCDFVAFAAANELASFVLLLPLCTSIDPVLGGGFELISPGEGTPIVITLPPGADLVVPDGDDDFDPVLESPVRFGDVNGDGVDDLIVQAECDALQLTTGREPCVLVGFGLGTDDPSTPGRQVIATPSTFGGPAGDVDFDEVEDVLALVRAGDDAPGCAEELPGEVVDGRTTIRGDLLAVGDFNADDVVDLVTTRGFFGSENEGGQDQAFFVDFVQTLCVGDDEDAGLGNPEFIEAEVSDINEDGALDLVVLQAGRDTDEDGELAVLINDGTGSFSRFTLVDRASYFEVEDTDGDGLDDVVGYTLVDEETQRHEGFVSFGRSSAGPESPISIGAIEGVVGVVAAPFVGNDSSADVIVLKGKPDDVVESTVLVGSPSRLLVSPLLFIPPGTTDIRRSERPITLATGRFDGNENSIAVLTEDPETLRFSVWHVVLGETQDATSTVASFTFPDASADPPLPDFALEESLAVAFDLDGNGTDEFLAVTPLGAVPFVLQDGTFTLRGAGWPYQQDRLPDEGAADVRPLVADLDGDGRKDMVVSLDAQRAVVVWNDDTLDPSAGITDLAIDWAEAEGSLPAFAAIDLDGTPPLDLVVVTERDLRRIELAGRQATGSMVLGNVRGDTIAAGDFDGDGLTDLAVGDGSATRILRARDLPGPD